MPLSDGTKYNHIIYGLHCCAFFEGESKRAFNYKINEDAIT